MFKILGRLETEQRKLEAVLTARFAVTTTGIATGFGENRNDLVGKVDGRDIFELLDRNLKCGSQVGAFSISPSGGESIWVRGSYARRPRPLPLRWGVCWGVGYGRAGVSFCVCSCRCSF